VVSGLSQPVHLTAPAGDAIRLFVVEQAGLVRLVKDGQLLATPYLDLRSRVLSGGERGLLSIAFHPDFAGNGKLYAYFTEKPSGDIRVLEITADPTADIADPATGVSILSVGHATFANHNGGQLAFGPDRLLYLGLGDGGGAGDPLGSGQDTGSLLGKLLRLDPAHPSATAAGNPFGNAVYQYGLRNPWRFSFDRQTGDLYIGDVGQDAWEEIDFQAAPAAGQVPAAGTNWGWNVTEGTHCYPAGTISCNTAGMTMPIAEYPHPDGSAVTGGFVYRGVALPDLAATGTYFYGDFGTGFVRTLRVVGGQATDLQDVTAALGGPISGLSSFGEDGCGELYLISYQGTVQKLAAP
jgi:glucose/arabinose dehydrogenase